jgi:putative hemolysin
MIGQLILQIFFIAFSAVLTCAETAVISVSDSRMEKITAGGGKREMRLKKITDSPNRFLSSMGAANAFTGFMAAACGACAFSGKLAVLLDKAGTGISCKVLSAVSVVLIVLAVSFFMIVFGRIMPKHIAMRSPEKTALRMSGFVRVIMILSAPAVLTVNAAANGMLRIIGIDPAAEEETVTEEEILMMSDAGAEKGTIDEDENRIIKNVFAFDDMTAGQVCTHRTEVSVLWESEDIDSWEEIIHRTRHSVFPVCGDSVDNVIGVLDAKDYFRLDDKSRDNIMKNAVREPYFVHENMKADRLFEQMKQKGSDHFAVVVDEYGGMSGIITVTDLVEQLVGEFSDDEDDEPQLRIEKTGENVWFIPGSESIADVSEELEITLPADKYDTFGGYVMDELGDIPRDGTQITLEADGLRIEVIEIRHHRIEACRVEKKPPEKTEDEE